MQEKNTFGTREELFGLDLEASAACVAIMSKYPPRQLRKGVPVVIEGKGFGKATAIEFLAFCPDCGAPHTEDRLASFYPPELMSCDDCGKKHTGAAWDIILAKYIDPNVGPKLKDWFEGNPFVSVNLRACYRGAKNQSPWWKAMVVYRR